MMDNSNSHSDVFNDSAISDDSFYSGGGHDSIEARNDSGISYADEMILSREDLIEQMPLPTQEEFDSHVKGKVLTSTDPTENLADRLDKIFTPTKSLSKSF